MQPVLAPAPFISQKQPRIVYLVYNDGGIVPVGLPTIRGDSVVGLLLPAASEVAVALPEVQEILARQPAHKRTVTLFIGLGVATGAVVFLATRPSGGGCAPQGPTEKPTPNPGC